MEENNKVMAASDAAHGGGPQVQNKRGGGGKRGKPNAYYEEEPMNVDPYRGGPHPPYYDPYFGYGRPPPPPGAMGSEGYGHPGELLPCRLFTVFFSVGRSQTLFSSCFFLSKS